MLAEKQDYNLSNSCLAFASLYFALAYQKRNEQFGNARLVRNVFEEAIARQSQRLAAVPHEELDKQMLQCLDAVDIPINSIEGIDTSATDVAEAKWAYRCPQCGKAGWGGIQFLGKKVVCGCGGRFTFPWWDIVLATVEGCATPWVTSRFLFGIVPSIRVCSTATPSTEGRSDLGVWLLHDEVVEAALVVARPFTHEIPAGLALAERAGGCLATVAASKTLGHHSNPPFPVAASYERSDDPGIPLPRLAQFIMGLPSSPSPAVRRDALRAGFPRFGR